MAASRGLVAASTVIMSAVFSVEQLNAEGNFKFNPFGASTSSPLPSSSEIPPKDTALDSSPKESKEEDKKKKNDNPRTSAAGFDPEALERGAKALREISQSSNAKKVGVVICHFLKNVTFFRFFICWKVSCAYFLCLDIF